MFKYNINAQYNNINALYTSVNAQYTNIDVFLQVTFEGILKHYKCVAKARKGMLSKSFTRFKNGTFLILNYH